MPWSRASGMDDVVTVARIKWRIPNAVAMKPLDVNTNQICGSSHAQVDGFDSLAELALDIRWSERRPRHALPRRAL